VVVGHRVPVAAGCRVVVVGRRVVVAAGGYRAAASSRAMVVGRAVVVGRAAVGHRLAVAVAVAAGPDQSPVQDRSSSLLRCASTGEHTLMPVG